MILTAIKTFIGGWTGYALIAGVFALGSLWLMHRLDEARYADLQAQVALNHAHQLARAVADQEAFDKRQTLALAAGFSARQLTLGRERERIAALQSALNAERKNDATLDRCLGTKLPDSIMRALPTP